MDANVKKFLDKGKFDAARMYAANFDRDERQQGLEQILTFCVDCGLLPEAKKTAVAIGRALTKTELEKILKIYITFGRLYLARETLVELDRNLKTKELESLVQSCLIDNHFDDALLAAAMIKDKSKRIVAAGLICDSAIAGGNASKAMEASELEMIPLNQREKQKMFELNLEKHNLDWAIQAASLMVEVERNVCFEAILAVMVKDGNLEDAQQLAAKKQRTLTLKELKTILAMHVWDPDLKVAKEIGKWMSAKDFTTWLK